MLLNFKDLSPNQAYGAMVQTIIPRPIAWVLSDNGDGSFNIAPFSFFNGVCSDPPLLMLSVGKKDSGVEKDTRLNIRERNKFVVHISSTRHINQVNASSASLAHGESEVDMANLKLEPIEGFELPKIVGCGIAMACELYRIDEFGPESQAVIYGKIISLTVSDNLIVPNEKNQFQIDTTQLDPLARLGGSNYAGIGEILSAKRPQ